jgi:hypothetical protein
MIWSLLLIMKKRVLSSMGRRVIGPGRFTKPGALPKTRLILGRARGIDKKEAVAYIS